MDMLKNSKIQVVEIGHTIQILNGIFGRKNDHAFMTFLPYGNDLPHTLARAILLGKWQRLSWIR